MAKTSYDIPTMVTKHHGQLDVAMLLNKTRGWLQGANLNFSEPKYKHKMNDTGSEIEVEWDCNKKINYYVKENVMVFMRFTDVKDIDVIQDGKKTTIQQGRVLIEVKGRLDLDWQKWFGSNAFFRALQDFLHAYVLKKTIFIKWYDNLYMKVFNFHRFIRQQLKAETPV